jgi:hypothetical protein
MNDLEGSGRGLMELLSRNLPAGTEENHDKPVVLVGVSSNIRTKCLPNTSPECYHFAIPLGSSRTFVTIYHIIRCHIQQDGNVDLLSRTRPSATPGETSNGFS